MTSSASPVFTRHQGMAVFRQGTGIPVVFVHGILTSSFIWRLIVPGIAETRQAISVDLVGCGESDLSAEHDNALETMGILWDLPLSLCYQAQEDGQPRCISSYSPLATEESR